MQATKTLLSTKSKEKNAKTVAYNPTYIGFSVEFWAVACFLPPTDCFLPEGASSDLVLSLALPLVYLGGF